jgi:hypothetical protein
MGGQVHILSAGGAALPFSTAETIRWQAGDTAKRDPVFILVLNNLALERPLNSGVFVPDMDGSVNLANDRNAFTACAEYLYLSIFGRLLNQADQMLGRSPHASKVRFESVFVRGLVANGTTALVEQEDATGTNIAMPRRAAVSALLAWLGLDPDVVFIVTNSPTHQRASAFPATDDTTGGTSASQYDGRPFLHYHRHQVPGMAAIHATGSTSLTGAHEFGHAFSSLPGAFIADLYVDGGPAFNRKEGRPIPSAFASYAGTAYASDPARPGNGYPPTIANLRMRRIPR